MNKIVVLGRGGMLGHVVLDVLRQHLNPQKYGIFGISQSDYNFTRHTDLERFVDHFNPHNLLLINCVGMLRQRIGKIPTSSEICKTLMLNSYLPNFLADRYKLIHVTTDCVYSGDKGSYVESDPHTELDLYGRSKSLGEPANAMCLRTSIIGPEQSGRNLSLYEWFMSQQGSTNGFTNHLWNGCTTRTLAYCILKIIEENLYVNGVRHIYSDTVSKYNLLQLFNTRKNPMTEIKPVEALSKVDRTLSTEYPEFLKLFNLPSIEEQIKEL